MMTCYPLKWIVHSRCVDNEGAVSQPPLLTRTHLPSPQECYLDGESSSLFYIARALNKLQSLYGSIPDILVKGNLSKVCVCVLWHQAPVL